MHILQDPLTIVSRDQSQQLFRPCGPSGWKLTHRKLAGKQFHFQFEAEDNVQIVRYLIRIDEMRESLKIVQQALRGLPGGEIQTGKPQYQVRVPAGESYGRVDGPKGELGFYVQSTGKPNPYRYHVRAPSFINLTPFGEMCKGHKVADVVVVLGSIDIVLGETDR